MGTKTYELMFQVAASMNQKFSSVFKKAANLTKIAEERQLPAFFYSLPRGSLKTATVA